MSCVFYYSRVLCLASRVKLRDGDAITPHGGKSNQDCFSEVDMRHETWDVSGDGRRQDVGQVTLDDETVTFLL